MIFDSKETFHRWYTSTKAGKRHARAAEAASETDRKWFEANPGESFYVRALVPNEFPPAAPGLNDSIVCVLVHQVAPGMRIRSPFERKKGGAKC
jgi:hypothetical protein